MFIPCNSTPSTNSRVFCTSPVTRLKMELEPCTSKEAEAQALQFGVKLGAQSGTISPCVSRAVTML
jgi:hypothetical protein